MCGTTTLGGCGAPAYTTQAAHAAGPGQSTPPPKHSGPFQHAHTATAGAALLGSLMPSSGATEGHDDGHASGGAHGAGGHDKITVQTAQNDAQANAVFQAAMSRLANLRIDQLGAPSEPGGDHLKFPESLKQQWRAEFPGLPVPNRIIVDLKSGRAVGALFVGGPKAANLGMGTAHQHQAGGAVMQHIWFTPGDMELAFSDVSRKAEARRVALQRP